MLPLLALRTGAGEEEEIVFLDKGLKSVANEAVKKAKEIKPDVPLDMQIDAFVLDETIYLMDTILKDGTITREEIIILLVDIRKNTIKLWNAVIECYRKNQELERGSEARTAQENEPENKKESGPRSATPDAYTTNVERVRTPKSMQKIMALIAAMMAVLSIAGPELITAADNARPMENEDGGGVVFVFTEFTAGASPDGDDALVEDPAPFAGLSDGRTLACAGLVGGNVLALGLLRSAVAGPLAIVVSFFFVYSLAILAIPSCRYATLAVSNRALVRRNATRRLLADELRRARDDDVGVAARVRFAERCVPRPTPPEGGSL